MTAMQADLFGTKEPAMPQGFRYRSDVVADAVQADLVRQIAQLPLKPFDFHGFEGKRRTASYGWKYDFDTQSAGRTDAIPPFLLPVRALAATFAGMDTAQLQQALVTEYAPGAPIGWHRDKGVFGRVVGISLLSSCTFRLRRKVGTRWERAAVIAEPGSVYVLAGAARSEWEHSIPPVEQLRYSVTFREIG
jgi:alkylated DNA repair dioxygenase AlkB